MTPFETRDINTIGTLVPTTIPVKTKRSFLSITYQKSV